MRKLIAAAGAIGLTVGLMGAGAGAAAAKEPERRIAICEHRLCLLVLKASTDSDGDGVTDVDEEKLRTNPRDPKSVPDARKIFDLALARELPSFEKHLTELVSLPQVTPDGKGVATAFGKLPFSGDGTLMPSVDDLMSTMRTNGFENIGTNLTATLRDKPSMTDVQEMMFGGFGNVAMYGSEVDGRFGLEGVVGAPGFGVNGDKTPTGITDGGFGYGRGPGSVDHDYTVGYTDGSWDEVSTTSRYSDGVTTTESTVNNHKGSRESGLTQVYSESKFTAESGGLFYQEQRGSSTATPYGDDGKAQSTSKTTWYTSQTTYADGSSKGYSKIITITYDKDGKETGTTTRVTHTETSEDGKTKSETTTTTTDSDGNSTQKYECTGEGCPDKGDNPGKDPDDQESSKGCLPSPDYVDIGVPTAADMARVLVRLNSDRTPNREDNGEIDITNFRPPKRDDMDPLVGGMNSDGVGVFAVRGQPQFNKAQPEYGPRLEGVGQAAGGTPPFGPWN